MSSRRQFLTAGLMAVGTWSFSQEVEAGRRRRCREIQPAEDTVPSILSLTTEPTQKAKTDTTLSVNEGPKVTDLSDRSSDHFIQPNSTRWQLLSLDMTENEVLTLLGEPLKRLDQTEWYQNRYKRLKDKQSDALPNNWTYGWLKFDSPAFPDSPQFYVFFLGGKVKYIGDPFNGEVSSAGKPTTPKLILPHDQMIFNHFPRWLDLRWVPPAGDYPQKYEIEIDTNVGDGFSPSEIRTWGGFTSQYKSDIPQLTISFGGASPARWRVRASNRHGVGSWSEYSHFQFTV